MAWRICGSVMRGEIDSRQKGVIRGKIWLDGFAEPAVLELQGNACPDLAGCLLTFTNPQSTVPMRCDKGFALLQRGRIGDLTASRRIRSSEDLSARQAHARRKQGQKPSEHVANALYVEWFSDSNGRIVIESAEYTLQISPPEWRLSVTEEMERQSAADRAWTEFLSQFDATVQQYEQGIRDPEAKWSEHDYERFMKASDARTDKLTEIIDKFGHSEKAQERIDQAMGWVEEPDEEEAEEQRLQMEEINALCESALNEPDPLPDPLREGVDWIRTRDGDIRHPLQNRCFESSIRISERCKELGLDAEHDDVVAQFLEEFQIAGAKLAGALGTIAMGVEPFDPAFTVAYLKRALDHVHKSQAALEMVAARQPKNGGGPVMPEEFAVEVRRELLEIREGILNLMQQYRKQDDSF